MYEGNTIGVVVPAYNEAGFVGDVIRTVPEYVDRVYVVDDASTDGTWDEIRRRAERVNDDRSRAVQLADGGREQGQRVVPIRHDENRGVGGAIKTGYRRALDDGVDVTAVMGGDGQMDPEYLPRLLDPIVEGRAGYAKANRLLSADSRAEMPRVRLVGNAALTFLTKLASGYWTLGDPQNGYTAISREALEAVEVEEMYEFYGYCNDLLAKLNVAGVKVADVPVPSQYGDETSHIDLRSYVPRVSAMLLRNFLWRLRATYLVRDFHPLVVLYGLGVLGGVAGVREAVRSMTARLGGDDADANPMLALLWSGMALGLAMVFDRRANEDLDVRVED